VSPKRQTGEAKPMKGVGARKGTQTGTCLGLSWLIAIRDESRTEPAQFVVPFRFHQHKGK